MRFAKYLKHSVAYRQFCHLTEIFEYITPLLQNILKNIYEDKRKDSNYVESFQQFLGRVTNKNLNHKSKFTNEQRVAIKNGNFEHIDMTLATKSICLCLNSLISQGVPSELQSDYEEIMIKCRELKDIRNDLFHNILNLTQYSYSIDDIKRLINKLDHLNKKIFHSKETESINKSQFYHLTESFRYVDKEFEQYVKEVEYGTSILQNILKNIYTSNSKNTHYVESFDQFLERVSLNEKLNDETQFDEYEIERVQDNKNFEHFDIPLATKLICLCLNSFISQGVPSEVQSDYEKLIKKCRELKYVRNEILYGFESLTTYSHSIDVIGRLVNDLEYLNKINFPSIETYSMNKSVFRRLTVFGMPLDWIEVILLCILSFFLYVFHK